MIYYDHSPSSTHTALVLIHGSGGSRLHWPDSIRHMPGVNTYALDLPGHGHSAGRGGSSVGDYADGVDAFISSLIPQRIILMGHSLGGAIAQKLALRARTPLAAIALVGSGARLRVHPDILTGLLSNFEQTVEMVCRWSFGPEADPILVSEVKAGFLATEPAVMHADFHACHRFDILETVGRIDVPTLIVSGAADRLTPPKYGDFLARNIKKSRHVIIEGAGHMMALEKPPEFTRIVADFISKSVGSR